MAFLDGLGIGTRYPLGLAIHKIIKIILVFVQSSFLVNLFPLAPSEDMIM